MTRTHCAGPASYLNGHPELGLVLEKEVGREVEGEEDCEATEQKRQSEGREERARAGEDLEEGLFKRRWKRVREWMRENEVGCIKAGGGSNE